MTTRGGRAPSIGLVDFETRCLRKLSRVVIVVDRLQVSQVESSRRGEPCQR